jgi:hypothetical protein
MNTEFSITQSKQEISEFNNYLDLNGFNSKGTAEQDVDAVRPNFVEPKWLLESLELMKHQRFSLNTPYKDRVKKSLQLFGKSSEYSTSLLLSENQEIYAAETEFLFKKKMVNLRRNEKLKSAKFQKIKIIGKDKFPTDDPSIAKNRIRLITIIHSVTGLDVDAALNDAYQLKKEFIKCVKKNKGLSCYGFLEAEVISFKKMEKLALLKQEISSDSNEIESTTKETKLINTKVLGSHLSADVLNGYEGQICIHLHAILVAKESAIFDEFRSTLVDTNLWNSGVRRIQIDSLSTSYKDKPKSVLSSLEDIARYISKGGTIHHGQHVELKYKITASGDTLASYDEFLNNNFFEEDSRTDYLSLSPLEIYTLHSINEGMMNFDESRTGHVLKSGCW